MGAKHDALNALNALNAILNAPTELRPIFFAVYPRDNSPLPRFGHFFWPE